MRRIALLVVVLLLVGCASPTPDEQAAEQAASAATACLHTRDSLRTVLHEQRVLVSLARQQMTRYAQIVARNPTQAKFLVGWTARAFDGVPRDSTP